MKSGYLKRLSPKNKLKTEWKSENSLRVLQDMVRLTYMYSLCTSKKNERERERGRGLFGEIMTQNLSRLRKDMDLQIEEAQQTLRVGKTQRSPLCVLWGSQTVEGQRQRENRESRRATTCACKRDPQVYFSAETLKARRWWRNIFKVLKEKLTSENTISGKNVLQKRGRS